MLILIDSDSLCYASALSVQRGIELVEDALKWMTIRLDNKVEEIVRDVESHFKMPVDYKMFLTGNGNFREKEFPLYKANRKENNRPLLLKEARDFLIDRHYAVVVNGKEADDAVAIEQTLAAKEGSSSIIAHIDKDIDQVPGMHYRWAYRGKPSVFYEITEKEGLRNLYHQALVGDSIDNIMYHFNEESQTWRKEYGCGKVAARKLLKDCKEEKDFYRICLDRYLKWGRTEQDLQDNLHQLFMIRECDVKTGDIKRWRLL